MFTGRLVGHCGVQLPTVELVDGTSVLGFLCEELATRGCPDITSTGGWRAYLRSTTPT
jgi:allophanate hydrolase